MSKVLGFGERKIVYMCGVDWQHEFQDVPDQVTVYDSVEKLKAAKSCWQRCGIVEVEVKLKKWVEEQLLDWGEDDALEAQRSEDVPETDERT